MKKHRILNITLVLILLLGTFNFSSAETISKQPNQDTWILEEVITDKEQIEKELLNDNVKMLEGKNITSIETYYIPFDEPKDASTVSPMTFPYPYVGIKEKTDRGNWWYFEDEMIDGHSFPGPGEYTKTFEYTETGSWNAGVSIPAQYLELQLGYDYSEKTTVKEEFKKELPEDAIYYICSWIYYSRIDLEGTYYRPNRDPIDFEGSAYYPHGIRIRVYKDNPPN